MALDFSRNYSPPGVYIEESESTLATATGIPPTEVAIVGPALGHQVNTEQLPLTAEDTRLTKKGIDTTSIVVTQALTGAAVALADYTATPTAPGAGGTQDYWVDLALAADPEVTPGTVVFVTYRYTDPDYFVPKRFESFEDVKDVYGEPLNTVVATPGDTSYQYVLSPLSLAAMLAIQNGASDLVLCAATPPPAEATTDAAKSTARRTALAAAYVKLDSDPNVNVLVAVTTGIDDADAAGALTDLKTHITTTALDGYFRFGVIGFDPEVETAPDDLLETAGARDRRIMLAYAGPGGLTMYSGAGNASFPVGNQYLAAAYGGRMARLPVHYSLTKQVIAGFNGVAGTPLSKSLKNQYSTGGIAIAEQDRLRRLTVRHGVTTDPSNVNTREAAVVRAKDALVVALSEGMATSGLIGAPLDEDLILSVKSAVQGVLESAVSEETIVSYSGLTLRQLGTDPTVVEVKFAYKPAYPLNYIVISFSIDMSTGATDLNDLNTDETLA